MEVIMSMANEGADLRGFLVDVSEDYAGEEEITNDIKTLRRLVGDVYFSVRSVRIGDVVLKAVHPYRLNAKASGLSEEAKILTYGNILFLGTKGPEGPFRSLNDHEMDVLKRNLGVMDIGEGAHKYNTYCMCNMEFV